MLPSTTRVEIFKKLPKSVADGSGNITAYVEYADRVNVSEKLDSNPIVTTLRYFADGKDARASPINNRLNTEITQSGLDIDDTIGERARVTLSINIYSKGTNSKPPAEIVDIYVDALLQAYLKDLPAISGIVVLGRSDVSDLSYLEDTETARRQVDILFAYAVKYVDASLNTIETIVETVQ